MLGSSSGRSRNHPDARGARRRGTPRERAQIDPPWDEKVPHYVLTDPNQRKLAWAVFASGWLAFLILLVAVLLL